MDLGPLTVLAGPNGSGKTNLLDVLNFIGDIARDGLERAAMRRGGMESIGRRSPEGAAYGPEVGFNFECLNVAMEYGLALSNAGAGGCRVKRESTGRRPRYTPTSR